MERAKKWYRRILQTFAYNLVKDEDLKLASAMLTEESIQELEQFINQEKERVDIATFYYEAGCASNTIAMKAKIKGNSFYQAYLQGDALFNSFIE